MAKKSLGYVELEWICPNCGTRNPGTATTCRSCGAAQPEEVQFQSPGAAQLTEDEEKIARAKGGPDVICPFCNTRNPAGAEACRQCGGDLTGGETLAAGDVVGAFSTEAAPEIICPACETANPPDATVCRSCGAPLGAARPAPDKPAASAPRAGHQPAATGGGGRTLLIIGGLALAAMIFFFVMLTRTSDVDVQVVEARWERTIAVEGLAPVERQAWRDQLPAGVTVLGCREEVRYTQDEPAPGAIEVCGTPYTVDTGTGMGEVVQDCEYQILEDRCTYQELVWTVVETRTSEGTGFSPEWPALALAENQRAGEEEEILRCIFTADDRQYSYTMRTLEEYRNCRPGSRWRLEVNSLGGVTSATPR